MAKFKIALSSNLHGVSVHNNLKAARQSQKKHGRNYKIFRWIGQVRTGYWEELR